MKLTTEEEEKLLSDCGFSNGICFDSVPNDLKYRMLETMRQWRWDRNQREFEKLHRSIEKAVKHG